MRRSFVAAVPVVAFALIVGGSVPAFASHMLKGKYHWIKPTDGDRQLHLEIDDLYWQSALLDAINEWAKVSEFSFKKYYVDVNCSIPSKFAYLRVCDGNYGNTGWGGLADVVIATDGSTHINRGRVRLNTYYQWDYHTARSVWCQETGHVLGLDHRGTTGTNADDPDSCMSYHPSSPEYPDQHDIDQLACQTHTTNEAEPSRNCTYASTDGSGSSCILGIICLSSQSQTSTYQSQSAEPEAHNDMVIIHLKGGETVLRFFMRPPRSAFVGPNRTLW